MGQFCNSLLHGTMSCKYSPSAYFLHFLEGARRPDNNIKRDFHSRTIISKDTSTPCTQLSHCQAFQIWFLFLSVTWGTGKAPNLQNSAFRSCVLHCHYIHLSFLLSFFLTSPFDELPFIVAFWVLPLFWTGLLWIHPNPNSHSGNASKSKSYLSTERAAAHGCYTVDTYDMFRTYVLK